MTPTVINVKDVNKLTELIYVRYNFKGEFQLLLDFESKPFETIERCSEIFYEHTLKGAAHGKYLPISRR